MNKVTLHGIEYDLPCYVISLGLDMQCHHCVTDGTILFVNSEKFVIRSEGIKIQLPISDLDDFYAVTKENRDMLQAQCDKEYNDWIDALNKQSEEIEEEFGVKQRRFKRLSDGQHYIGDDRI